MTDLDKIVRWLAEGGRGTPYSKVNGSRGGRYISNSLHTYSR
ncbi:MAG: hypothetical protein Q8903_13180 [Bacteroidota bacterium]|nr:hypothetical protein [Bacteroidota bacterium]